MISSSRRLGPAETAEPPAAIHPRDAGLADLRFRALVGAAGWAMLPGAVRARFSKRYAHGQAVTYVGVVTACRFSTAGWILAQACRLIGGPLPQSRDVDVPAVVTVTEDAGGGGQIWTRMYGRAHGFPQVIHSAKRFAGPTGLEEYLGAGFGIALTVTAHADGLRFSSDHYFLRLGPRRFRLPAALSPGRLTIEHIDRGEGGFAFVLTLVHPLLGRLVAQTAIFRDAGLRGDPT